MKRILAAALAASLPCITLAAELPLKRVVLSTSGLAQFTHSGEVAAGSTVELSVRLDQVDDLLKSLTVFDKQGAIGAVSLAGKTPLEELFRDLPFGPEALASPSALLNALVGAEIEVEGEVNAKGKVFRVEEEAVALPDNGGQTVKHRLTMLTDKGLVQAILEHLSALRFTEPLTKAQIERALAGLSQNRAKDRRMLSIKLEGQGAREVGLSYVVAAPVWKTSYRLVLPKEGGKARLQGWGVLENLTGSDWKDVELTLVSGNPVALRQPLYSAFFATRPEIAVTSSVPIVPKTDDAEEQTRAQYFASEQTRRGMPGDGRAAKAGEPYSLTTRSAQAPGATRHLRAGSARQMEHAPAIPDTMAEPSAAAEPEEAATQVLYRFASKVSLAAGSTMMAPFADLDIAAARVWLYQPDTNARHPLAAVKLTNEGDSALPAGIITAFETGPDGAVNFVGDARLPLTPKGASKFVTFALDNRTDIRRTDRGIRRTRLGKFVNGEMTLTTKSRWYIDYEITPPVQEDREVVIDEARSDGWKPSADMKDVEETAARVRYKVSAPRGKTTKVTLAREMVAKETIALGTLEPAQIMAMISGLENENPAVRDAIAKLGEITGAINKARSRRNALEGERKKISEDQDRIRMNLSSVGSGSDLGRRYLDMLRNQEDRLAAIDAEDKSIDAEIEAKKKTAEQLARSLSLQ